MREETHTPSSLRADPLPRLCSTVCLPGGKNRRCCGLLWEEEEKVDIYRRHPFGAIIRDEKLARWTFREAAEKLIRAVRISGGEQRLTVGS